MNVDMEMKAEGQIVDGRRMIACYARDTSQSCVWI